MATYPYTATRVKTMKAELLREGDYIRLRKMGLFEIIRFLESGEYKKDVDVLSAMYRGNELLNLALNQNLARTVDSLLATLNKKDVIKILSAYASKWVFYNLKLMARIRINNLSQDDLKYSLIPVSFTTYEFCAGIVKNEDSLVKLISSVAGIDEDKMEKMFREKDLSSIEDEIDKRYYRGIYDLVEKNEVDGILKEFFLYMAELVNIRNILKMKLYNINESEVRFIVPGNKEIIRKLLVTNYEGCIKILKESKYRKLLDGVDGDKTKIDNNMEKSLLTYSGKLLHMKPLSIFPIFGYLIAKEVEIRNLRLLLNAKAADIEESFIEDNIIIQ